ncbi:MAG: amidohydrolase, partial [Treponema sp.]|nr:amidohydrolase [Treponema sp.]
MKIDFHVHITPPDITANWEKYAQKEPYFSLISRSKVNKFAAAEDVIEMLHREGFDRAVVFGFAFCDIGLCRYVNDYVIEKTRQFPDKLTGFAVAPPGTEGNSSGRETAAEIERCHSAGLKGAGELFPHGQGINLEDEKQTQAITGVCTERGIPLLLHCNEPVGHLYAGKTDMPFAKFEKFICANSGLKIILAHWGGGIFIYETMREINDNFRNVWYDTAVTPFLYDERIYRAAKALGLTEKILFGSDFPILPPSRYTSGLENSG